MKTKTAISLVTIFWGMTFSSALKAQLIRYSHGISNEINFNNLKTENDSLPKVDQLILFANSFIGKHYRRGGTTQKGFDCSGFTMTVFSQFGIRLPHTSAGQGLMGIEVLKKNVKKGDLIFFKGRSRRGNRIGHVGIVISEKGEPVKFIHSSVAEGVMIDNLDADYYRKRFVKCTRIFLL